MISNILRCKKCGNSLIAEELESHDCKKVVDYKIEGNMLWLSDGERWYPRKLLRLPPKTKHPFSTPEDETEPRFILYLLF